MMAAQLAFDVPAEDPVDALVRLLVSSGAWDRESAVKAAPRYVAVLRSQCRCGGRGGKQCRLRLNDPRHGKRNGYVNGHCGCDDCTYANTRYVARRRLDAS